MTERMFATLCVCGVAAVAAWKDSPVAAFFICSMGVYYIWAV